jgi:hypothetical protein
MRKTNLWPEEAISVDSSTTLSVTIEHPDQVRTKLWYRVPVEYSSLVTTSCDPFVVATLMIAMNWSTDLMVHGEVSPSLLRNLAEFQAAWACWRPKRYQQIEINAEVEREQPSAEPTGRTLTAFSGGVDSCFTLLRHRTGLCGRQQRNIQAGLMVHGFDIPLEQEQMFARAVEKSRKMVASLGVELIPMATNFRQLGQDWEEVHGCAIASCMMLLQGVFTLGLIGSFLPYQALKLPWGTNPVTDGLLSSNAFQIIHDGAAFTRLEKLREIADWSEALTYLRVCWEGPQPDRNCCRCEKCIRTILGFRSLGIGNPSCFEQEVTEGQILELKGVKPAQMAELEMIWETAKAKGISDHWVSALEKCIVRNQRQALVEEYKAALKTRIKPALKNSLHQLRSVWLEPKR